MEDGRITFLTHAEFDLCQALSKGEITIAEAERELTRIADEGDLYPYGQEGDNA